MNQIVRRLEKNDIFGDILLADEENPPNERDWFRAVFVCNYGCRTVLSGFVGSGFPIPRQVQKYLASLILTPKKKQKTLTSKHHPLKVIMALEAMERLLFGAGIKEKKIRLIGDDQLVEKMLLTFKPFPDRYNKLLSAKKAFDRLEPCEIQKLHRENKRVIKKVFSEYLGLTVTRLNQLYKNYLDEKDRWVSEA